MRVKNGKDGSTGFLKKESFGNTDSTDVHGGSNFGCKFRIVYGI